MLRLTLLAFVWFAACSEAGDPADTSPFETTPDATIAPDAPDTTDAPGATRAEAEVTPDSDSPEADAAPAPTLELVVTVPASTPSGDTVYVSGSLPVLGDWDGRGLALTKGNDGRWRGAIPVGTATTVGFKITRGSWDTVEKNADGSERDNRTATIGAEVAITVAAWRDQIATTEGDARIDFIRGVSSQYLGPDRDLIVYVPPGYDANPGAHYPVLYMHDGQNLMDPATSAFGVAWEVDDTATRLIHDARIEPVIIVGVYNTGDRMDEYTPVRDDEYGGGNADAYGRFLIEELKPDIDATYRTRPEATATGLAGSSLGGLVSLYLGLERSDVFGRLGVVSPSVWWANEDIIDRVNALTSKLPLDIWLDIGTAEGGGGADDDARALRDALIAEGWVLGQDLTYAEYPGAAHNEAAWAARCDDILEALYGR